MPVDFFRNDRNLFVDFLRPEANVVILIVELTGGGDSDVLPIKRLDRTGSRGEILQTILWGYRL